MSSSQTGLVLLNKPQGVTSFQAMSSIKRMLQTRRAGHTGTLDKFATGLLLVLTDRLTRISSLFMELDKSYRAIFTFGLSTDTLDPEGAVVAEADVPTIEQIERAMRRFIGQIEQLPPAYSAVHVDGRRAYQISRRGQKPDLKPRKVFIHNIEILRFDPPDLEVTVDCAKGTYIRALARDLGEQAGSCAYVSSLCRTRVGSFRVEEAVPPEDFLPERDVLPPTRFLAGLGNMTLAGVREPFVARVLNGIPMDDDFLEHPLPADGLYALLDPQKALLAIVERVGGRFRYKVVVGECRE